MTPWAMSPAGRHLHSALQCARNARWFLGQGNNRAEGMHQFGSAHMWLGIAIGVRSGGIAIWPSWRRAERIITAIGQRSAQP